MFVELYEDASRTAAQAFRASDLSAKLPLLNQNHCFLEARLFSNGFQLGRHGILNPRIAALRANHGADFAYDHDVESERFHHQLAPPRMDEMD